LKKKNWTGVVIFKTHLAAVMLLSSKLSPSSSSNITESGDNSRGGLGSGGIGAESVVALLPSDVCSCLLIETNVLPLLPLLRPSTELLQQW
jgi:hypothetical protein